MRDDLPARLGRLPHYTIERELGGGGMSRVFLAEEITLGRRVAIKVLEVQGGPVDAERFRREVQRSAKLTHPHIVPLLSAGEIDGLPHFVMPFVEGASLRARLREGVPSPAEAVRLLRNVMAALVPAALYLMACGLSITGLRWRLTQGQIGTRVFIMAIVVALLGLPVIVGAGLVLSLRRAEREA